MSRETEQWKKQLDREKENKNKIASKYQIQTVFYGPSIFSTFTSGVSENQFQNKL